MTPLTPKRLVCLFVLLCGTLLAAAPELELGAGVAATKTAYRKYDVIWDVFPMIDYEDDLFYVRDFAAGVKFFVPEDIEKRPFAFLSLFGAYEYQEFDPKNSSDRRMRMLTKRRGSLYAGARIDAATRLGMLSLSAARDTLGHGGGFSGKGAVYAPIPAGRLEIMPSAGFYWADAKYNNYYYGISGRESRKSGLHDYAAGGSIAPFAGMTIYLTISKHWEIVGHTEIASMPHALKNSPMTAGSAVWTTSLALNYLF